MSRNVQARHSDCRPRGWRWRCTAALVPWLVLAGAAPLSAAPLGDTFGDLLPGRNFPTATAAFGTGRSENIDVGDVDHDGDYDAVVANGGDGAAQQNRIYINNGGIQGGAAGTFADETATRFAGVTVDTSRDIEFGDLDADGDLDIVVANRGTVVNGGEVSRAYTNQGGLQFGNIGFFTETTDTFWGTLVSVPEGDEEGAPFGVGPWRDYACDCDFGDLDDDGDLDLFHSSYGPNLSGNRDSRIFMNDGSGVFDELWPWVDPGADIQLHTLDIDLVDLDDDFDLDIIASSRDSQARTYRNNLEGGTGAGALFTDRTQTALLDTGAQVTNQYNYEVEPSDMDGDGDFDLWMVNYSGTGKQNSILRNNGDFTFTKMNSWIKGDPSVIANEADYLDYDGDDDLDVFIANFSGTNWLYQSGLTDGLDPDVDGLFHRTGTSSGGSQASWPELPPSNNGGTSLDADCADMDGDGDPDVLIANDGNQQNRYFQNVLGVPDTHAPTFQKITVQGDKADGTDTVIHAALRDNAAYYVISYDAVDLLYRVDSGDENVVQMVSQGGQQFRGVIPAEADGTVTWRIRATDDAGNTSISSTFEYEQTSSTSSPWQGVGHGTIGVQGDPYLIGRGDLTGGAVTTFGLVDAAPNAFSALFISAASTGVPFKGGTLYAIPVSLTLNLVTDPGGMVWFQLVWPMGVPSGVSLWWQYAIQDASVPLYGVSLSNALKSTVP